VNEQQLTVGSLFTGIGGLDLGLERAGMRVIWQSEIEPAACEVLRRHWPGVANLGDIRRVDTTNVERPSVVCGGFPCQPFSSASRGRRKGKEDSRYLWPDMLRVVSELRPTWVIGENVTHIDRLALEQVVSDLESSGYEVQTFVIPACAVGLDHRRDRYWILGHTDSDGESERAKHAEVARLSWSDNDAGGVGAAHGIPSRLDRMRLLGNAIVPGIAEIIGRAIVSAQ
jgi:DNA (cytosine-5)-methyltransferase 1